MSDNKNKFEGNSRYFTICIYSTVTVLIMAIIIRAVFFWESTSATLNTLLSTLSPFFMGILIAFLISPLVSWMRKTVFKKWLQDRKSIKQITCNSFFLFACYFCFGSWLGLSYS